MAVQAKHKNIKDLIHDTVDEFVDFIKPTYGPAGNKVLISHPYDHQVIDDGVTIAKEYKSDDEAKNAIISIIREVAVKTNDRVGDGTTSSLIMLQALMKEIRSSNKSPREIVEELQKGLTEAKDQLKSKAKKVSGIKDLQRIAKVSYNDSHVSELIAALVNELGPEGVITTDNSTSLETTIERIDGMEVLSGFTSGWMVNNNKMECVIEKPVILVTNFRLTQEADILPIIDKAYTTGYKSVVIFAEHIEGSALQYLLLNNSTVFNPIKQKVGSMNFLAIALPHGDKTEFVMDLAILTGADAITVDKGYDFTKLEMSQLGKCAKIVASKEKTIIYGSKGKKEEINKAISILKDMIAKARSSYEKERLERRLARFTNGIAVVKVGAATENELKTKKAKIEDSVNAVKAASKGGVVCGAGLSLSKIQTSSQILNKALKYPFHQLKENSELDIDLQDLKENQAVNAVTKEIGDYLKLGIIDPVDVLIAGVESAVSIASLLITTKGLIYEVPEKK